jgi:Holliday junction resolvase RusA-like endonuclease
MNRLKIKPLSVNECFQGRRFKTPLYKAYEEEVLYLLKKEPISSGKLFLRLTVGVSSKNADLDNIIKPLVDILQKKLGFNDRQIYAMDLWKEDVRKGEEFIEYDLSPLE